jgi:hypothetical protein
LADKSVTIDEFGHLPAGVNVLSTGDFRYCQLNPPLMNLLSALPLRSMEITEPPRRGMSLKSRYSFWVNGYAFMDTNREIYRDAFAAGRIVTVVIVALLGLLVFVWARLLVPGRPNAAGLFSAALIWFSPNIMAHARLVTTDAGITFFMMLSLLALFLFVRKQTILRAAACGIALGLAQLVKFTAIYLYATHFIILIVSLCSLRGGGSAVGCGVSWRRLIPLLVGIFVLSIAVLNAGYGFQRVGRMLDDFTFASQPMQALSKVLPARMIVPFPEDYVRALDRQLHDTQQGDPSFLFGQSYAGGRWYYFLALVAVKTPLPCLLLAILALYLSVTRRGLARRDELLILLPGFLIFIMLSLFSNKQLGLRMVLPALATLWLWVGATLARSRWTRKTLPVVIALVVWFAVVSAVAYPDYLAYFNEAAGGPARGHHCAIDSNLDWGQDLPQLERYMARHELDSIQLLYFGRVDPAIYGIEYEVPRSQRKPGHLAVSRSLYGRGYWLFDHGKIGWGGPFEIEGEASHEKVATLGHSIDVYEVTDPETN